MIGCRQYILASCVLVAVALAGCQRQAETQAPAAVPSPPAPPPTINPADLEDVTASYACDDGSRVDIVRDLVARVTLGDGRVVKIEVVENSTPRTYMDNGLTFQVLSDDRAELSDEDNRSLGCRLAGK